MTGAIWALAYEISNDDRETYLDWFHQIHIPEKLARPGYRWAAHFEGSTTTPDTHSYIALFGGISTRIFLDPSPAQLKTKQDDLTREMMAQRRNPFATILVHEWSDSSTPSTSNDHMMAVEPINSDRLDFLVINVIEQGEAEWRMDSTEFAAKAASATTRMPLTMTPLLINFLASPGHQRMSCFMKQINPDLSMMSSISIWKRKS